MTQFIIFINEIILFIYSNKALVVSSGKNMLYFNIIITKEME